VPIIAAKDASNAPLRLPLAAAAFQRAHNPNITRLSQFYAFAISAGLGHV
jgi:hypothetical protein